MSANCYLTFEDCTLDPKFTFRKRKCWRILGHFQLKSISLIILGFAKERVGDRFDERQGKRPALRLLVRFSRREQVTSFTSWQDPFTALYYTILHCTLQCTEVRFYAPAAFSPHQRGLLGSENHIRGLEWTHSILKSPKIGNHYTYNTDNKFKIGF